MAGKDTVTEVIAHMIHTVYHSGFNRDPARTEEDKYLTNAIACMHPYHPNIISPQIVEISETNTTDYFSITRHAQECWGTPYDYAVVNPNYSSITQHIKITMLTCTFCSHGSRSISIGFLLLSHESHRCIAPAVVLYTLRNDAKCH
jgi:hypothetical protein